nr:hypothetical protein [Tanacetum cinerariifolium]
DAVNAKMDDSLERVDLTASSLDAEQDREIQNASIPMETQKPLLKDEDGKEVNVHMYRSMIGSLMYLTSSRAFKRGNTFVDYKTELVEEGSKKTKEKVTEGSSKSIGTEPKQENVKKQKIDEDKETTELKLPEGDYEIVLWGDLKVMFEPHIEDEVWKMQQRYKVVIWTLFNSCDADCLSP